MYNHGHLSYDLSNEKLMYLLSLSNKVEDDTQMKRAGQTCHTRHRGFAMSDEYSEMKF